MQGSSPRRSTSGGTSHGCFIAPHGIEVVELGPTNRTIHQIDEHVAVRDLDVLSDIYERVLERFAGRPVMGEGLASTKSPPSQGGDLEGVSSRCPGLRPDPLPHLPLRKGEGKGWRGLDDSGRPIVSGRRRPGPPSPLRL